MKTSSKRFLTLFIRMFIIVIVVLISIPLLYYGYIYASGYLKGASLKITVTPEVIPASEHSPARPTKVAVPAAQPVSALHLEPIITGLTFPTYLTHANDERLFIVEKSGRIMIARDGVLVESPFIDVRDLVGSEGSEQGLLSIAFHPDYAENGRWG